MQTLTRHHTRALSIDVALMDRLAAGEMQGNVHSAFARVLNVITSEGLLIALRSRSLEDAPWSVRADIDTWATTDIHPGAAVRITDAGIAFGGEQEPRVTFDQPSIWHPTIAPFRAHVATLESRIRYLSEILQRSGVRGGVLAPSVTSSDPFATVVARRLRASIDAIVHAECAGDRVELLKAVEQMLGLGPGLTPSGDDALMGMALVAARPGSRIVTLPDALASALKRNPHCTTVLARTTVCEALRGRAPQSLIDLTARLTGPVPDDKETRGDIELLVERVFAIGHTSGTDILCGILTALRLERILRGSA